MIEWYRRWRRRRYVENRAKYAPKVMGTPLRRAQAFCDLLYPTLHQWHQCNPNHAFEMKSTQYGVEVMCWLKPTPEQNIVLPNSSIITLDELYDAQIGLGPGYVEVLARHYAIIATASANAT